MGYEAHGIRENNNIAKSRGWFLLFNLMRHEAEKRGVNSIAWDMLKIIWARFRISWLAKQKIAKSRCCFPFFSLMCHEAEKRDVNSISRDILKIYLEKIPLNLSGLGKIVKSGSAFSLFSLMCYGAEKCIVSSATFCRFIWKSSDKSDRTREI